MGNYLGRNFGARGGQRPYELNRCERSAKYALGAMRYVCVGAADSRPVVFPMGKQRRREAPTMQYQTFANEIRLYNGETWNICNIGTRYGQIGSAQKLATLAGRYYPLYYGVIAPGDHWVSIRCAEHHPYELNRCERSAKYALGAMRYVCVGAAISRPVVFPMEKQRRRIAPTMQYQTFLSEIQLYNGETWNICNIGTRYGQIGSAQKLATLAGG